VVTLILVLMLLPLLDLGVTVIGFTAARIGKVDRWVGVGVGTAVDVGVGIILLLAVTVGLAVAVAVDVDAGVDGAGVAFVPPFTPNL
jgi:hypothetical protein